MPASSRRKGGRVKLDSELAPVMPHSPEIERMFLGAIIMGCDAPDLNVDDFYLPFHKSFYRSLQRLKRDGKPTNELALFPDLLTHDELDQAGGIDYIARLPEGLPKVANLKFYADTIKMKAAARRGAALCQKMSEDLASANGNTASVLAEAAALSSQLTNPVTSRVLVAEDIKLPDLPESAFDGRLGEICQRRMKDFPLAYSWPALLTAAGVLVRSMAGTIRTNLYTALVGPPHSGKSQAIDRASFLMDLKPPFLAEVKSGSIEGFLKQHGDGREPVLFSPDELSHTFEKAQISNASYAFILNSCFYKDNADLTIAHGNEIHFNRRLSLIGGIVDEKFEDSFGGATTGGLYDRFLFGQCPTGVDEFLYRPLEGLVAFDGQEDERPVNSDVWESRDELATKEKINPRLLEIALRTAAICAAFDGRKELCARDLGPAWELARYQTRVRLLLKPNPGKNFEAQVAAKILNYLNRHAAGGAWMAARQVLHATNANDYGPSVVNRALDALAFSGSIERSEEPAGRGQKRRLVRLTVETPKPAAAQVPAVPREISDEEIPF
jgi:hypothetical protein